MSFEQSLGSIALSSDDWITDLKDKLKVKGRYDIDKVDDENAKQVLYMLATLVFDLTRRMGYLFDATRDYGLCADQELAKRIDRDRAVLRKGGAEENQDYPQLARRLQKLNMGRCPILDPLHARLLDLVLDMAEDRDKGYPRKAVKK